MIDGEVVHDYKYMGYHIYVVVVADLEDHQAVGVTYEGGEHQGLNIAVPQHTWDKLNELGVEQQFLRSTRILGGSFVVEYLAQMN